MNSWAALQKDDFEVYVEDCLKEDGMSPRTFIDRGFAQSDKDLA